MAVRIPPRFVRFVEGSRRVLLKVHQRTAPPPAAMMEFLLGACIRDGIVAAVELGIPEALVDGPLSAEQLARRVDADPDAVRRLMRALIGRGIFRKRSDGRYALNALANTLRTGVERSVVGPVRLFGAREHVELWGHLTTAVKSGRSAVPAAFGVVDAVEYAQQNPAAAGIFNRAMADITDMTADIVIGAYPFGDFPTIVDVGGGVGQLLAAVLAAAPDSRGILYDLPHAVADAQSLPHRGDLGHRMQIVQGSFFDDVPAGGDLYVLKNVIHDWPDDDAVKLLRNIRTAAPAATVLLIEFVIPENSRADHPAHWTDLEMLVVNGGRERTVSEFRGVIEAAGLRMTRVVPTATPITLVEAQPR
jgi:C-methyltransferase